MIDDPRLLAIVFGTSVAVFVATLVGVPRVIARLPVDYFTREPDKARHNLAWAIAKNVLGASLVALGIALLVLPGPGIVTIIAGLGLLDLPGRQRIARHLIKRAHVQRAIDAIRQRAGKPPLALEGRDSEP